MIRRHPIIVVLFVLILAAVAVAVIKARQPKPVEVRVSKAEVTPLLTQLVDASGEIRAHDMVDIQAELAGVIVELPVKEGQSIKKGQTLLKIDPFQAQMSEAGARGQFEQAGAEIRRMEAGIASARANLQRQSEAIHTAEAALQQARVTAERDQNSLERYKKLMATKAVSRDQYESVESKARISQSQVDSAQASLDQSRAEQRASEASIHEQQAARDSAVKALSVNKAALSRASDDLSKATITSPLDGVVVRLNVDIGERAVPGIQSNPEATLMTLANLTNIEAELKVDEADIVDVKLGDEATIKVDALPDLKLKGKVSEISLIPIQNQSANTGMNTTSNQEGKDFKVVVSIAQPPAALRIGMSCEADILAAERKKALTMPIQALTAREIKFDKAGKYLVPPKPEKPGAPPPAPAADDKATSAAKETQGVFVKGGDGFAHFRPVKTGIMGESNIEVLDGLKAGEEVITGPLAALRALSEWTLVKVSEGPAPAAKGINEGK